MNFHPEENVMDHKLAFSPELVGKECIACGSAKLYKFFRADTSYRDGRRDMCLDCEASPRLSTKEHISRLREINNSTRFVKGQQLDHQEEVQVGGREGRRLHHDEFARLLALCLPGVQVLEGRVQGDMAIYQVFPGPQRELGGASFKYLGYIPMGFIPEFNQYTFDARNVPTSEIRGWRTPLLRLIKTGVITEAKCNEVFGRPTECPASVRWYRQLWEWRNSPSRLKNVPGVKQNTRKPLKTAAGAWTEPYPIEKQTTREKRNTRGVFA